MDNEYENRSWYSMMKCESLSEGSVSQPSSARLCCPVCVTMTMSMCVRTYFSVACSVTSTLTSVAHVRRVRVRKYCN